MCLSEIDDYIAFEVEFTFTLDTEATWIFSLGASADEGLATFIDGVFMTEQTSSVDWEGDIGHADVVVDTVTLGTGSHTYRALLF